MRKAEIIMALALIAVGFIVLGDSVRLGFRWGTMGPEPGFLPFYLGLGVILFSFHVFLKGLRKFKYGGKAGRLIPEGGLKPIVWVLFPATAMILLTEFIGLHWAAFVYLIFYMRLVGKIRWTTIVPVSVLIPLSLYIVFDRLFMIPLPQGLWGKYLIPS